MKGITSRWIVGYAVLAFCISLGQAYGKDKVKGLITSRQGEALTLQTQDSEKLTILLTENTKIEDTEGKMHRKKEMAITALVPGLAVEVEGDKNEQGKLVADKVKFSPNSLDTANAIQAGLQPTEEQLQATEKQLQTTQQQVASEQQQIASQGQQIQSNRQKIQDVNKRFSDLSDYDVKNKVDIYFAPGRSTLSAKDQAALKQLATQAVNQTGYLVSVKGFADSTGNPVLNQKLSMDRADAVLAYLEQTGNIPLRHIVAPGAMGTADPVATNETAQGRAENRRVEVKVLVNKGLAEK